ncbi:MAG: GntR family transcriptional regulator, partial [Dorea sp.]|nr:GntR family transcriptional regulator [Dorea sp.]
EDGLVVKKQGIGTFVSAKKLNRVMDKLLSFTEICEADGKKPATELISVGWVKASASVARELKVDEDERVLRIYRLRLSDGEPVMLEETFFSEEYKYLLAENLTASTYEILRLHGCVPKHARKIVGICYAKEPEAKILKVSAKQPLLLQKDTVATEDGTIIHFSKLMMNRERYSLTILT